MDKTELRDKLFQKYFECNDGILLSDLLDKLSFIPKVWKQLHLLCKNNIKHFHSTVVLCKIIEHNNKTYLILKLRYWRYIIIDIEQKENITKEEFKNNFNEEFFVKNFDERKEDDENLYSILYDISEYTGNISELLNFYQENKNVLSLSPELYYKFRIDEATTSLYIDLTNAKAHMTFLTPEQFLYEHLFLEYDLTPSPLQDAGEKMGIEKMKEFFSKIKDIKIPLESIPKDLYNQYLNQNINNKKRKI